MRLPAAALAVLSSHLHDPAPDPEPGAVEIAVAQARMSHAGASWIVYLNPDGGRYFPDAANDAGTNRSTIVRNHVGAAVDIPAYALGAASWARVLDCVRDHFAPFDIHVTDEDPGDVPHLETVVGGSAWMLNLGAGQIGIAAAPCEPMPGLIQFVFAQDAAAYGEGTICGTAAQETAHAFGLDHEYLCEDLMSYLTDCGPKSFVDRAASCGEYSPRGCICGRASQNSRGNLLDWVGAHGGGDGDPADALSVVITSPDDGDEVPPGFTVTADARGPVDRVFAAFDGSWTEALRSPPWRFPAPADLPEGPHDVEVLVEGDGDEVYDRIDVVVSQDAAEQDGLPDEDDDGGGGGGVGVGGCRAAGGSLRLPSCLPVFLWISFGSSRGRRCHSSSTRS